LDKSVCLQLFKTKEKKLQHRLLHSLLTCSVFINLKQLKLDAIEPETFIILKLEHKKAKA
jgi:hypothetical protein